MKPKREKSIVITKIGNLYDFQEEEMFKMLSSWFYQYTEQNEH